MPQNPAQALASRDSKPVLIACAHGTANVEGQGRINQLRAEIAALLPDVVVLEAYVDVQEPALPDVVASLAKDAVGVVVPLLLTTGFHVEHDIAQAVASHPGLASAVPLGPDPRLAALLSVRLGGVPDDWAIVLAAAGSSRPNAAEQIEVLAADLSVLRPQKVIAAYGASASPLVPDAVAKVRADGAAGVVVASYLLAPGYFHDQLSLAGADRVTDPLLPSVFLAELAVEHFDVALRSARQVDVEAIHRGIVE